MKQRLLSSIVALFAANLLVGCPASPSEEPAPQAEPEPVGDEDTALPPPPPPPPPPPMIPAVQPRPDVGSAPPEPASDGPICGFTPADEPVGGVVCPEGCVMVLGAPIDEERGCARTGPMFEAAMACLRLPADLQPGGRCYRSPDGHTVATALTYPALAQAGWTLCEEDYPFRSVEPCPQDADGQPARLGGEPPTPSGGPVPPSHRGGPPAPPPPPPGHGGQPQIPPPPGHGAQPPNIQPPPGPSGEPPPVPPPLEY